VLERKGEARNRWTVFQKVLWGLQKDSRHRNTWALELSGL